MFRQIKSGSVDQSVNVRFINSTTGIPEASVDHATAGLALWYRREGGAKVTITAASLAALTTAHTDGGVEPIADGVTRLDLPDAAVANGVTNCSVGGTATGMIMIGVDIQLVAYDPFDAVDLGLTALTGHTPQTGDSFARLGAPAGASIAADIVTLDNFIDSEIADIQARLPAALVSGRMSSDVVAISGDTVAADNLEAAYDGAGYAGGTIKQGVDVVAISGDTTAADTLESYTDGTTPIPANVTQISGDTTAADNAETYFDEALTPQDILDRGDLAWASAAALHSGTAQAGAATTITLASAANSGNGFYDKTSVTLTGGTGAGQSRVITGYVGATRVATAAEAWITNPDSSTTYDIDTARAAVVDILTGAITSGAFAAGAINAAAIAADAIGASELAADAATEIGTAVWATTTRLLTAGTNIALAKGTGVTGFNDLSAAQVNAEADTALADYDPPTKAELDSAVAPLATAANLATVDTVVDTILVDTAELQTDWVNGGRLDLILDARASQASVDAVQSDTDDIQTRLPAALVSGRIDASVGAMAANVITATAINADAITDAKVASDVTIASVTGAVGSVTGAVGSVTGDVGGNVTGSVGSVATGGIVAASFAANAINAAKLDPDVTTELQAGLATAAALTTLNGFVDTEVAAIKATTDKLDTVVVLDGAVYQFTANALELAPGGGSGLDAAGVRAAVGLASANLDTQLGDLPTNGELATALGTADDAVLARLGTPAGASMSADIAAVKAETAGIQSDTNDLQTRVPAALVSGRMDSSVGAMAANVMTAAAAATDLTTELQTGLATAANITALNNLSAAQVNAEVDTALADYDAPTNAEMVARTLAAAAYATAAGVTAVETLVDTEIAAIKADTAAILLDTGTDGVVMLDKAGYSLSNAGIDALFTRAVAEAYSTDGSTVTLGQFIYESLAQDQEHGISGTTWTVKRRDGTTTALTLTLNSASSPTAVTRAS